MIDYSTIQASLAGHALVREIDRLDTGPIRIETAFLYPDGASIDLFMVEDEGRSHATMLSDLGQTMAWLLDVQVKPWLSRKRQGLIDDVLRLYAVEQRGGELVRAIARPDMLMPAIVSLGQACLRVADLMFTKRSAIVAAFNEQVEEMLGDVEVSYTPNAVLEGRYGASVRVDFLAEGRSTKSAILALSSGNASQAHVTATEIFRRWYDLDVPTRNEQRVTVLDDRVDVYRADDIHRLRDMSQLVAFSDRLTLEDLLAA